MSEGRIRIRRIYDEVDPHEGARVLVDRVWPRGMRKEAAQLDSWTKELAPSTELRKWYGHDPDKFERFRDSYREELDSAAARAALQRLRDTARERGLSLLTAARDVEHSQAAVLAELLRE